MVNQKIQFQKKKMNDPTIFLDFDETLVHSCMYKKGQDRVHRIGEYFSIEHPIAKDLIAYCRSIAPTKILSMGSYSYIKEVSDHFNFEFSPDDIYGWQDYLYYDTPSIPYSYNTSTEYKCYNHYNSPNSILIDNNLPFHPFSKLKMNWIGIPATRYIMVNEFKGHSNDDELDDLKFEIKRLLK